MQILNLANVVFLLLAFITYSIISRLYRSRQFAKFAADNGCDEVFHDIAPFPLSLIDPVIRLRRIINVARSGGDVLDDYFVTIFDHKNTFKQPEFGGGSRFFTIEPANLQAIVASQFDDFETGKPRYNQFKPVLGRSIFSSDGAFWQHSRALFRPHFSRDNINNLESTEAASKALIEAIGATDSNRLTKHVELLPLLYNFTLDTSTEFLFGESVSSQAVAIQKQQQDSQGPDRSYQPVSAATKQASSQQFMDDFALTSETMINRIRNGSLFYIADGLAFRRAVGNLKRFTMTFVERALAASPSSDLEKSPLTTARKPNLLAAVATQTQNRTELRNQALALLFAGRDTTASLLAFSMARLAMHPDVLARLRAAVLRDFPIDATAITTTSNTLTFASLKGCRPLQHFLNEVLRLHPPVPINNRVAVRDTTLPVGGGPDQKGKIAIPKGTPVVFSVYVIHRRKDLWGDDALEFKPERWEKRIPAWQFLPFHGGPRICLGQQYALTEAAYVLVRLLQTFDTVEPVHAEEMRRFKKGLGLAMWPDEGVNVRMRKAS